MALGMTIFVKILDNHHLKVQNKPIIISCVTWNTAEKGEI